MEKVDHNYPIIAISIVLFAPIIGLLLYWWMIRISQKVVKSVIEMADVYSPKKSITINHKLQIIRLNSRGKMVAAVLFAPIYLTIVYWNLLLVLRYLRKDGSVLNTKFWVPALVAYISMGLSLIIVLPCYFICVIIFMREKTKVA